MDRTLSHAAFERARQSLPGGVNSPVRCFGAVKAPPVIAARGEGPYLWDIDGNRYTDFLMSWGANILGHAHPAVTEAIKEASARGVSFGLTTEVECELAELIREAFPSVESVRLVNSGTEAVMSALRVARGYTMRDKVVVFEGCYHGHSDALLVKAGSGLATLGIPSSAGIPREFAAHTLQARYNDLDSVVDIVAKYDDKVACILVEPVAGNMGVVPPEPGFIRGLRALCDNIGALLVFDEVITGFRIAWGGAQQKYGVQADLTTLGKIIGGGLPIGAFGGKRKVLEKLAPLGDVYQAGTLSGNPIVASAGCVVLRTLRAGCPYEAMERRCASLVASVTQAARASGQPIQVNRVGSMFTIFFTGEAVKDYASAKRADAGTYGSFFRQVLERGVLLAPSQWEAGFISLSHSNEVMSDAALVISECLDCRRVVGKSIQPWR